MRASSRARRIRATVTDEGNRVLDDQNDIVRKKFVDSLRELTEEEQRELASSIETITHYINKMQSSREA